MVIEAHMNMGRMQALIAGLCDEVTVLGACLEGVKQSAAVAAAPDGAPARFPDVATRPRDDDASSLASSLEVPPRPRVGARVVLFGLPAVEFNVLMGEVRSCGLEFVEVLVDDFVKPAVIMFSNLAPVSGGPDDSEEDCRATSSSCDEVGRGHRNSIVAPDGA